MEAPMSAPSPPKGKGHRQPRRESVQLSKARDLQIRKSINLQGNADESDFESNQSSQPKTPPRTPRRADHHSAPLQNKASSTVSGDGPKQNPRPRHKVRNDLIHAGLPISGYKTPPLTSLQHAGIPLSPRTTIAPAPVAYAGPTFHASPAPSALPIPSFYSKSVPNSSGNLRAIAHPDTTVRESSTPPSAVTWNQPSQTLESPLDVFFKADREEKARARSASSLHTQVNGSGPFNPPGVSPLPDLGSPSVSHKRHTHQDYESRSSAGGIFAMELDRTPIPDAYFGPAFSTPYSERINAARVSRTAARPIEGSSSTTKSPLEKSEALKAYLFSAEAPERTTSPAAPSNSPGQSNWGSLPTQFIPPTSPTPSAPRYEAGSLRSRPQTHGPNQARSQGLISSTIAARRSGHSSSLRKEVAPIESPSRALPVKDCDVASPTPPTSKITGLVRTPMSPASGTPASNSSAPRATSADLQGMEDTLRKMLKLESSRSP